MKFLKKIFNTEYKELEKFKKLANEVISLDDEYSKLTDEELKKLNDKEEPKRFSKKI